MRRSLLLILLMLLATRAALAVEKAGPKVLGAREVSTLEQYSTRPLYIYNPNGRPDPFVADFTIAPAVSSKFSITELRLNGVIESAHGRMALFSHGGLRATLTLRGSKFYSPEGVEIKDVQGRILPDGTVRLQQGEKKIVFNLYSAAER